MKLIAAFVAIAVIICGTFGAAVYLVGHRQGRGSACFEVAVNTKNALGQSLQTQILSKPGVTWDYSFWGHDCTISIAFKEGASTQGGRWRFDMPTALLFADDAQAEQLFPAAGRWRLERVSLVPTQAGSCKVSD